MTTDQRPPIAIFYYEFPFNDAGEQVWNWRQAECFTIEGDAVGALAWHIKQACDPECPTNFRVEWLDANNGRTTEPHRLQHSVSCCSECAKLVGLKYASAIGGNLDGTCQLCGKNDITREYRTGVTAADIRDDMR